MTEPRFSSFDPSREGADPFTDGLIRLLRFAPASLDNQYAVSYSEEAPHDGASVRCSNLARYCRNHAAATFLIVSQAPGHQGARWSGIPVTDTSMIASGDLGVSYGFTYLSTEPSSQTVHEGLGTHWARTFVWSAVPWHPAGETLNSNRMPSAEEIGASAVILRYVLGRLQFRRVAALGETASQALRAVDQPHEVLPHPFYSGASACIAALRALVGRDIVEAVSRTET
jgi:hypothetical protein